MTPTLARVASTRNPPCGVRRALLKTPVESMKCCAMGYMVADGWMGYIFARLMFAIHSPSASMVELS
jgi:hypothetical protein